MVEAGSMYFFIDVEGIRDKGVLDFSGWDEW
jgi:hypothetical protein